MILRGLGQAPCVGGHRHRPAEAAAAAKAAAPQHHHHKRRPTFSPATQPTRWPLPPGACSRAPNHNRTRHGRGALQVTAALFEPPAFSPSKLSVEYLPGAGALAPAPPAAPRRYTLTHNDITGALRLSIGATFNARQVRGFYTRVLRDEVVAEWRWGDSGSGSGSADGDDDADSSGFGVGAGIAGDAGDSSSGGGGSDGISSNSSSFSFIRNGRGVSSAQRRLGALGGAQQQAQQQPQQQEQQQQQAEQAERPSLHVFCHVSGEERWLAPPALRNFVFRREMGLVLDTLAFADRALLASRPDLRAADVLVHFQSAAAPDLDVVEHWGTLGDRRSWQRLPRGLGARLGLLLRGFPASPRRLERTPCGEQLVLRARDGSERVWAAAGPSGLGGGMGGEGGELPLATNSSSSSDDDIGAFGSNSSSGDNDDSGKLVDQQAAVVVDGSRVWQSSSSNGNGSSSSSSSSSNGGGDILGSDYSAPASAAAAVAEAAAAAAAARANGNGQLARAAVAAAAAAAVVPVSAAASDPDLDGERAAQPVGDRATAAGPPVRV